MQNLGNTHRRNVPSEKYLGRVLNRDYVNDAFGNPRLHSTSALLLVHLTQFKPSHVSIYIVFMMVPMELRVI